MGHLALVREFTPTAEDHQRENTMRDLLRLYDRTTDKPNRRILFDTYRKLHQQRGPKFVAWLEAQKGLSRG